MGVLPKFILREVEIQVVASLMSEIAIMEDYLDSDAIDAISDEELKEKFAIYNRLKETLEIKKRKLSKYDMDSVDDVLFDSSYYSDVDRNVTKIKKNLHESNKK